MTSKFKALRGIGPKQAKELAKKYKTVSEIKKSDLPEETNLALEFKVRDNIPRSTITRFLSKLNKDSPNKFTPAGSYRRNKPSSHDIDLLTTLNTDEVNNIFSRVFKKVSRYQSGDTKSAFYILYGKAGVKIDVYHVKKPEQWPLMLVYLTGPKEFNIKMRSVAKNKGWLLNQEALKDQNGRPKKIRDEVDLFKKIGWAYIAPENRE